MIQLKEILVLTQLQYLTFNFTLRKGIAYVGQEPVLFAGTISDNLKLAKENATDQEMINCL